MARRIVIEEPCEHGRTEIHKWLGPAGSQYPAHRCPGGSRRVLDPGSLPDDVIEAAAKAMHESVEAELRGLFLPMLWDNVPESAKAQQRRHARAALVAAVDALAGGEQP